MAHARHVLQLAAVNRALVEGLACHVPGLIGPGGPVLVDLPFDVQMTEI